MSEMCRQTERQTEREGGGGRDLEREKGRLRKQRENGG